MILIRKIPELHRAAGETTVALKAERRLLSKKIWRGRAEDGQEFGFELEESLEPNTPFHRKEGKLYIVRQESEPVLIIALPQEPERAAKLAWALGNLHVPIAVAAGRVLLADEPGLRRNLERREISYKTGYEIFRPLSTGHAHDHAHAHGH